MMTIQDAPWIRYAEMFGPPEPDPVYCPVCGAEDPEELYRPAGGKEIIGCCECMSEVFEDECTCNGCGKVNPEVGYLYKRRGGAKLYNVKNVDCCCECTEAITLFEYDTEYEKEVGDPWN